MIYRSGYKGVKVGSKLRISIKHTGADGTSYKASRNFSYNLDKSEVDLDAIQRKVDAAIMEGNFE